jgi:adenosylcobinamide-phosphate synthase
MDEPTLIIFSVILAYILDLILGDPTNLPHPIVGFGKIIHISDKKLNKNGKLRLKGAFVALSLCIATYLCFWFLIECSKNINHLIFLVLNTLFLFYGIANKTLIKEGKNVFNSLKTGGIEQGRKQLSRVVGRDTSKLSENQIKTAVLETLSENLSDGVVAPLFYYLLGGIPAMMTYKMINTLDSMIGYKNEKYLRFGWFSARLDDFANLIPARITAFLMALVSFSIRSFIFMIKYGNAHSSPNSGYPESALAGILNCRFGGPNTYNGITVYKDYIGINQRDINKQDLNKTVRINHSVCLIMIILICLKVYLFW